MAGSEDRQAQTAVVPFPPVAAQFVGKEGKISGQERLMTLELEDGSAYQGYSFGAEKSISGELVFQTGMERISLF
jgi:carbamoyl-phosphate synthase/aspartate carbamoyltransferase